MSALQNSRGGILSTYANFGRGDYVQGGFCPDTVHVLTVIEMEHSIIYIISVTKLTLNITFKFNCTYFRSN